MGADYGGGRHAPRPAAGAPRHGNFVNANLAEYPVAVHADMCSHRASMTAVCNATGVRDFRLRLEKLMSVSR